MLPGTLNSETYVTQIEIKNEIKTTEIKKPGNESMTSVKYSDLLREKNAKECDTNVVTIQNSNTADSNALECGKLFTVNNLNTMETGYTNDRKKGLSPKIKIPGVYPAKYWVYYDTEGGAPMEYTPDRNEFIAKVFSLTFVMLLVTACFVTLVALSEDLREIFLDTSVGKMVVLSATVGMILLNYTVMCSPCMRMVPCNFIVLILAVIFMSLIAAYVTAKYDTTLVIYAFIGTAITVLVCFFLALTSFDFTKFILYIVAIAVTFFAVTSVTYIGMLITGTRITLLQLVLLIIGTIINIVVLILELQLILGGKAVALNEDDYALGAYFLYTSIVDLFLKLMQILGITLDEDSDLF